VEFRLTVFAKGRYIKLFEIYKKRELR